MKVMAAYRALRVHGVQHLYHDSVVQTGETCCATDMTEYEKTNEKLCDISLT